MGFIFINDADVLVRLIHVVSLHKDEAAIVRMLGLNESLLFDQARGPFRSFPQLCPPLGLETVLRLLLLSLSRKAEAKRLINFECHQVYDGTQPIDSTPAQLVSPRGSRKNWRRIDQDRALDPTVIPGF